MDIHPNEWIFLHVKVCASLKGKVSHFPQISYSPSSLLRSLYAILLGVLSFLLPRPVIFLSDSCTFHVLPTATSPFFSLVLSPFSSAKNLKEIQQIHGLRRHTTVEGLRWYGYNGGFKRITKISSDSPLYPIFLLISLEKIGKLTQSLLIGTQPGEVQKTQKKWKASDETGR